MPAPGASNVLGSGAACPFQFAPTGGVQAVAVDSGLRKVEDSIHLILSTKRGERAMRPTFGSLLHKILFQPNDPILRQVVQFEVTTALEAWERRIKVASVQVLTRGSLAAQQPPPLAEMASVLAAEFLGGTAVGVVVNYVVVQTNRAGSYVYQPGSAPAATAPAGANLDLPYNLG